VDRELAADSSLQQDLECIQLLNRPLTVTVTGRRDNRSRFGDEKRAIYVDLAARRGECAAA
jgi:hypothetical protein